MENPQRTVSQLVTYPKLVPVNSDHPEEGNQIITCLVAVCDDGTLWERHGAAGTPWQRIDAPPADSSSPA